VTLTFDLWPWKSIGFQTHIRTKYVPNLVKIHWRMLILVFTRMLRGKTFDPVTLTFDLWPWKSIGFQILLMTKYVPSLVKIHWRMLILECSQGCYGRTDGRKEGRTDGSVTTSLRNFVRNIYVVPIGFNTYTVKLHKKSERNSKRVFYLTFWWRTSKKLNIVRLYYIMLTRV
jgi:hypothetical protein